RPRGEAVVSLAATRMPGPLFPALVASLPGLRSGNGPKPLPRRDVHAGIQQGDEPLESQEAWLLRQQLRHGDVRPDRKVEILEELALRGAEWAFVSLLPELLGRLVWLDLYGGTRQVGTQIEDEARAPSFVTMGPQAAPNPGALRAPHP